MPAPILKPAITFLARGVIECAPDELDLDHVLMSGQSFLWQKDREGWWVGTVGCPSQIVRLCRTGNSILVESLDHHADVRNEVCEYLSLETSIRELFHKWRVVGDDILTLAGHEYPGLRVLRQDPVECLIGFICSSASPIHRIRRGMAGLCRTYGESLGEWQCLELYRFPELEALANARRSDLDLLGIGFRGRYIREASAVVLENGGRDWLLSLRTQPYAEAKAALLTLPGVGEKIADCVCLFSLNKHGAVPIDVHMARVAARMFPDLGIGTAVTPKTYAKASQAFRDLYGEHAGWAQQYLFYHEIVQRGLWDPAAEKHRPRVVAV